MPCFGFTWQSYSEQLPEGFGENGVPPDYCVLDGPYRKCNLASSFKLLKLKIKLKLKLRLLLVQFSSDDRF